MPYLQILGRQIYYEQHGEGPPLVLMHHGFGASAMWEGIWPSLVRAGFQVTMYDRRGYGRTAPGEDYDQFYISDGFRPAMREEMAAVLDALGIEKMHLLGQCEGAVASVDFAAAFPERVVSLAMGSVQAYSLVDMVRLNQETLPNSWDQLAPAVRDKLSSWHGPEWAPRLYEMGRTKGGAYGVGYFDLRPLLPQVTCPCLVIYPDRSALFGVEQGVALYRDLPSAELAVLPATGHNTYEQRPEDYLRLFLEFHERQAARGYQPKHKPDPAEAMTCAG